MPPNLEVNNGKGQAHIDPTNVNMVDKVLPKDHSANLVNPTKQGSSTMGNKDMDLLIHKEHGVADMNINNSIDILGDREN